MTDRTDYSTDPEPVARPFVPWALHFADSDVLEYVTKDVACIYEEIDGDFAVVRDMETNEIIGFRLCRFSLLKR